MLAELVGAEIVTLRVIPNAPGTHYVFLRRYSPEEPWGFNFSMHFLESFYGAALVDSTREGSLARQSEEVRPGDLLLRVNGQPAAGRIREALSAEALCCEMLLTDGEAKL